MTRSFQAAGTLRPPELLDDELLEEEELLDDELLEDELLDEELLDVEVLDELDELLDASLSSISKERSGWFGAA